MIHNNELIDVLLNRYGKSINKMVIDKLIAEKYPLNAILSLTLDKDPRIAFRSAWLLDHLNELYPDLFFENLFDDFLERFPQVSNESCKRHYARILSYQLSSKNKASILKKPMDAIVETCFTWAIDPNVKVAVKAHCLEALFQLRKEFIWVEEELPLQLELLQEREPSPAMHAKCKDLLQRLSQKV